MLAAVDVGLGSLFRGAEAPDGNSSKAYEGGNIMSALTTTTKEGGNQLAQAELTRDKPLYVPRFDIWETDDESEELDGPHMLDFALPDPGEDEDYAFM